MSYDSFPGILTSDLLGLVHSYNFVGCAQICSRDLTNLAAQMKLGYLAAVLPSCVTGLKLLETECVSSIIHFNAKFHW